MKPENEPYVAGIVVCPIMTTGYTYRQCIKERCTLWSEPDKKCGIMALVDFAANTAGEA